MLIVFRCGSAWSTVVLSLRSMPKTNCCVPYCHVSSTRHTQSSWHRLPKDKETKRQWAALIRNDTLHVDSNGTSVCGCHFLGGRKTYAIRLPSMDTRMVGGCKRIQLEVYIGCKCNMSGRPWVQCQIMALYDENVYQQMHCVNPSHRQKEREANVACIATLAEHYQRTCFGKIIM